VSILFIYSSLPLGGIETFFLRFAKQRHKVGKKTKILLIKRQGSNSFLLQEIKKYSDVYFLDDFVCLPKKLTKYIPFHLLLLLPLSFGRIQKVFDCVEHVHVTGGIYGLFFLRLAAGCRIEVPLTIGIYHSREFIWGGQSLPFYENANREFFCDALPRKNVCFFNDRLVGFYEEHFDRSFTESSVFPLGVIENETPSYVLKRKALGKPLVVGSVGRLIDFKTYNLWMIDVVHCLIEAGVDIRYFIYGAGPLKAVLEERIESMGLRDNVFLLGSLEYEKFAETVSAFDVFVGSGTAIVEAASLGVPSIVGIESISDPLSYGFFSDILGFTYNEDGLHEKLSVVDVFLGLLNMNEAALFDLRVAHLKKAAIFSMGTCVTNFDSMPAMILERAKHNKFNSLFFRLRYSLSYFFYSLSFRLRNKSFAKNVYG
jgi:glycosyltransferase involved in cell wall biosynthesis